MKIWIDLTNAPHINFFKPFVKEWKDKNYSVIITCRNLSNTIALIEQNNWVYYEIGGHAGKSSIFKILYFPFRVLSLWRFLRKEKPDIGISHSSFYSPVVSRMLNIPSIYLNDNEYAKGNLIAFKFASLSLLPESLEDKAKKNNWVGKFRIKFYPGIKEGVYLSQRNIAIQRDIKNKQSKKIYLRPAPWTAQYYEGDNFFFDDIIKKLQHQYQIVLLPRDENQINHFCVDDFKKIEIARKPLTIEEIYNDCDLFIGAGGTMTRELAFLGTPTISIYQDQLLEVDKFLITLGYMKHSYHLSQDDISSILNNKLIRKNALLDKGSEAFSYISKYVELYAKS